MLNTKVDEITMGEDGKVTGIKCGDNKAEAPIVLCDPSYTKKENLKADVFGPLAFDNSVSKKSSGIKGIKNSVAGQADVLLVPNVEAGNALVKMMIYFMGACAAGVVVGGKVPVVITSRSDEALSLIHI